MRRLGSRRLAGKVHLALPAGKDHFALPAGKDHILYSERGAMECDAFGIPAERVEGEVPPIAGRA
jgi:hypothetical protein